MKTTVVFVLSCLVLFSCVDNALDKSETRSPVLERHYNMETGEAIAEKSFEYDRNRNLIRESYKPLTSKVGGYETLYEYDAQDNRIMLLTRFNDAQSYTLVRFIYDGHKKKEEHYFGSDPAAQSPHTKVIYYYNGNLADSSVTFQKFYGGNEFKLGSASYFRYDNQERVIEEQRRFFDGSLLVVAINTYDGDLLKETCNPVTGQEGVFNCTKYEYNSQKKLVRKYSAFTGTPDRLLEEHTYTEGLLTQTKVFNQLYYLPAYSADPTPYTLLITYEY